MKKLYCFLPLILIFGALQGEEEMTVEPISVSQPGRYQISAIATGANANSAHLFLLDTQTGAVWGSHNDTWSKGFKEWKLIVSSLEQ